MPGLFVTGTDTGVGKTAITCGLAAALVAQGRTVGVMKPVETGCAPHGPRDARALAAAAGGTLPIDRVCPYRLSAPLAPDVAARLDGVRLDPALIVAGHDALARTHDVTLIEGAGGLLVPIDGRYTMADLARDLGLPILVVVDSKLGAVNHTLLTIEVATARGLAVRGYLLNHVRAIVDQAVTTNAALLARSTDVPCLGRVPWSPTAATDPAALVATTVDWARLLPAEATGTVPEPAGG